MADATRRPVISVVAAPSRFADIEDAVKTGDVSSLETLLRRSSLSGDAVARPPAARGRHLTLEIQVGRLLVAACKAAQSGTLKCLIEFFDVRQPRTAVTTFVQRLQESRDLMPCIEIATMPFLLPRYSVESVSLHGLAHQVILSENGDDYLPLVALDVNFSLSFSADARDALVADAICRDKVNITGWLLDRYTVTKQQLIANNWFWIAVVQMSCKVIELLKGKYGFTDCDVQFYSTVQLYDVYSK